MAHGMVPRSGGAGGERRGMRPAGKPWLRYKEGDFRRRLQIVPEKADPSHVACSIGRSVKDGKWYGWSHRAYHGFPTRAEAVRFARSVS